MKSLLFLSLLSVSSLAFALPKAPVDDLNFNPTSFLKKSQSRNSETVDYDFEGIVKLSNCSGALVQFEGQPDTDKALVMTNGHCIQKVGGGYLKPGEVLTNFNVTRKMKIFKTKTELHPITTTKILYATMTYTDVAFYELTESFAEILAATGVKPLTLSSVRPSEKTSIQIISGYWEKGYSCEIDAFIPKLLEGEWTFEDSLRYTTTCDTIGGTSGSPILEKDTRTVVAINNTSNESGERCTLNNPCEVDADGAVTVRQGIRYGQQTYQTYTCLTSEFKIDLTLEGCLLPK